jgi:uncharacterized protein YjiS (DUF1127 family)
MEQILQYEMMSDGTCRGATHSPRTPVTLIAGVRLIVRTALGWNERIRQRQALAELDDRPLRDIGISRAAAATEVSQPFWK